METRKSILGPEHPDTLTSIANLASTYRDQGRWTEAEKLEVQVMEIRKSILGLEHPDTLISMANLASTYLNQGRWTEAEKLEVQVMETRKSILGPEHPSTLNTMNNLSHTWKRQGRDSDALAMLEACVPLLNQQLGASHPHTMSATATLREWQMASHHRSSPVSSSGRRHEIDQSGRSTQARHSQGPGINHQSSQLITKRLQPLDQLQNPRKRR
jgi:Tetratricopeptide repeat